LLLLLLLLLLLPLLVLRLRGALGLRRPLLLWWSLRVHGCSGLRLRVTTRGVGCWRTVGRSIGVLATIAAATTTTSTSTRCRAFALGSGSCFAFAFAFASASAFRIRVGAVIGSVVRSGVALAVAVVARIARRVVLRRRGAVLVGFTLVQGGRVWRWRLGGVHPPKRGTGRGASHHPPGTE
jgi:hypothetical protein